MAPVALSLRRIAALVLFWQIAGIAHGTTTPPGILLDTFKQSGDADDTAALHRAVAAGVPIRLGPRIYTINNFIDLSKAPFILTGIPGKSIIRRKSALGSQFFEINAVTVDIVGVTFDMNSTNVTANQWGVYLPAGGQNVLVKDSIFENNSGTIGTCFGIYGRGPAAGGSLTFAHNAVTNCSHNAIDLQSITHGDVEWNDIHDNPAPIALYASADGPPSPTNMLTNVTISNNLVERDRTGIEVGGYSPPYHFGTPPAAHVRVANNQFQDDSGTALVIQADNVDAMGNRFMQSSPSAAVNTAINCFARYALIRDNTISYSGGAYGIDCGGGVQMSLLDNRISMRLTGTAINIGGNLSSTANDNNIYVSGKAQAVVIYEVETDGSLRPFPTIASGITVLDNHIEIASAGAGGIDLFDNAGGRPGSKPIVVAGNSFVDAGRLPGPGRDINDDGEASSIVVQGNTHDGSSLVFTRTNRAGGGILYVEPSAGGAHYAPATTILRASCGRHNPEGWVGSPLIYHGAIIGVRVTAHGSGCAGTPLVVAVDPGGGSGARFVATSSPPLPDGKKTI